VSPERQPLPTALHGARTVGVVGLGIMGSAMAGHLLARGWAVIGYDVDELRRQQFASAGGTLAADATDVARRTDRVLSLLPGGDVLRATATALAAAENPRLLLADCGTLDIEDKAAASRTLASAGATMLDCTVSGTGAQARTRDLVVWTSGDTAAHDRVAPVFADCARACHHVGPFGHASKLKFVANLLVAVHTVAAAEAMVLAERSGLDLGEVLARVREGAGNSRMWELRGPQMVEGCYDRDVASRLDLWQKDLQVIGKHAKSLECAVPLFQASAQVFTAAMAQGMAGEDMAAVCRVMERLSGIDRHRSG